MTLAWGMSVIKKKPLIGVGQVCLGFFQGQDQFLVVKQDNLRLEPIFICSMSENCCSNNNQGVMILLRWTIDTYNHEINHIHPFNHKSLHSVANTSIMFEGILCSPTNRPDLRALSWSCVFLTSVK